MEAEEREQGPRPELQLGRGQWQQALEEGADDSSHNLRRVHVDVVVAGDFHKLVPLGRGVGGEILPAQTPVASCLQVGQRQPLSSPCLFTVAWGLGGCHRNVGIQAMKLLYISHGDSGGSYSQGHCQFC